MAKRIVIIDGHPDQDPGHLVPALCQAYRDGAVGGGHTVDLLRIADMEFPLLRTSKEFLSGTPPAAIAAAQSAIRQADHLLIAYPLWLGSMPALLKGFMEQTFRPGFAFSYESKGWPKKGLKGRSARVVVTMGMPALAYRLFFRAHSLKSLERNILKFCGIGPVRETLIGMVEGASSGKRDAWFKTMRRLGGTAR
ncbi:MAG: NAD(P)H-dependent oxidoreductase [Azospirillaceae bacterium]